MAGPCVHDRRRIPGVSDYWTVEDSASWREMDFSTLLTRDIICRKRQLYTKHDNICPLSFLQLNLKVLNFRDRHICYLNMLAARTLIKGRCQLNCKKSHSFTQDVFALFVIGLDCHLLVFRNVFLVQVYFIVLI